LAGAEGLTAGDVAWLTDEVRRRLTEWQGFLTASVAQARQILRKLLVGRIIFHPQGRSRYTFTGTADLSGCLTGGPRSKAGVSPTGFVG
jgi:hypothetical protein